MLDVHAPHEPVHTWKAFFIHIATMVVGLFIAVALEQSVEATGRRHERTDVFIDGSPLVGWTASRDCKVSFTQVHINDSAQSY